MNYPPEHQVGMKVPVGGSSCFKCRFISDDFKNCRQENFIQWHGSATIPEAPGRYCCDFFTVADGFDDDSWLVPWQIIPCPESGCAKQIQIDVVDEEYVTEPHDGKPALNPDFVEADNWLHDREQKDHPPWLEDHHIAIAKLMLCDPVLFSKRKAHELAEVVAMAGGMKYEKAHTKVANPVEASVGVELRKDKLS